MTATRRSLRRRVRQGSGCPSYASDFTLTRGRCLAPRCGSRWGVTRLTVDFTDASTMHAPTFAAVECSRCGRVWYRTAVPTLGQYQSTRLTLILPGDQRRWYARGRWRIEGESSIEVREATMADLLAARDDWRKRADRHAASKAKAKAKAEAASAAAHADAQAWLESMAAREAEAAEAEAEAAAREARGEA